MASWTKGGGSWMFWRNRLSRKALIARAHVDSIAVRVGGHVGLTMLY